MKDARIYSLPFLQMLSYRTTDKLLKVLQYVLSCQLYFCTI